MKKTVLFALILSTIVACGDDKAKSEATADSNIPASCQEYISMVEKLVAKSPDAAKTFQQALDASKERWKTLSKEQIEATNATCEQMIEQIKPLL